MGFVSGNHLILFLLYALAYIGSAWYIVRDARRRNQSGLVWGLISLFVWPLGAILWFIVRRTIPIVA